MDKAYLITYIDPYSPVPTLCMFYFTSLEEVEKYLDKQGYTHDPYYDVRGIYSKKKDTRMKARVSTHYKRESD